MSSPGLKPLDAAFRFAKMQAKKAGSPWVEVSHLLWALVQADLELLAMLGVSQDDARLRLQGVWGQDAVRGSLDGYFEKATGQSNLDPLFTTEIEQRTLGKLRGQDYQNPVLTAEAQAILDVATTFRLALGHGVLRSGHVWLAVLSMYSPPTNKFLTALQLERISARHEVLQQAKASLD